MENVYIPGSRIFLGNLASDRTSERELRDMFLRYGNVKEVVVRKGFGFVQFDSSEAAQKAIAAENGRMFRGYRLGNGCVHSAISQYYFRIIDNNFEYFR